MPKAATITVNVLADNSGKYTPNDWAQRAKQLKREYHADAYISEVNTGGDLVKTTHANGRPQHPNGKVIEVHAARWPGPNLWPRSMNSAECTTLTRVLETQMCEFVPGRPVHLTAWTG